MWKANYVLNIKKNRSRSKVDGGESGDPLNLEDGEVAESPVKDANSLMVKAVQSIPDADKPPGNRKIPLYLKGPFFFMIHRDRKPKRTDGVLYLCIQFKQELCAFS